MILKLSQTTSLSWLKNTSGLVFISLFSLLLFLFYLAMVLSAKNIMTLSAMIFEFIFADYHSITLILCYYGGNERGIYYYSFSNILCNRHFGKGMLIRPLFTGLWSLTCSALGVRKHVYIQEKTIGRSWELRNLSSWKSKVEEREVCIAIGNW